MDGADARFLCRFFLVDQRQKVRFMEAFFNIADALDVTPEELIQIAFLQDKILKRK